jgi:hypothetical protein
VGNSNTEISLVIMAEPEVESWPGNSRSTITFDKSF